MMRKTKKFLPYILDYGLFIFLTLFFAVSYFAVRNFDVYTNSPAEYDNSYLHAEEVLLQDNIEISAHENSQADIPLITDTRQIREYRGIIGIYDCYGELVECFDADVSALPLADRKILENGIEFCNESEMRDFLESFAS